jgi:hypothetical protein
VVGPDIQADPPVGEVEIDLDSTHCIPHMLIPRANQSRAD